jgi:flagellar hook-associated protein 2
MAISSIGAGSGLPIAALLEDLRTSQQGQLTVIKTRQTKAESRISGYGQLKVELENLAKAAKVLEGKAFETLKTTVTGNDFTAIAKDGSTEVSYDIEVSSLARAQSLVTSGVQDRNAANGQGGVIDITIDGELTQIDLTGKGTSLKDLVAAINGHEDLGLQASIINNGGDEPYQLMITAKETGTKAAVTSISVAGNEQLGALLGFGQGASSVQERAASNAQLTVNGVAIVSQSNTVTDALEGVTLNLTGASGTSNKLTVEKDVESVAKAVEDFVTAYNDVNKKIKQLTSYNIETNSGAALVGDSLTRSIQTRLASVLNSGGQGPFATLSQIGVRTQDGGLLSLDKTQLTKAMSEDMEAVKALFMGEQGVGKMTQSITKIYTDTHDGLLVKSTEGANKALDSIKSEYERAEMRIEAQMELYRKQFTAMDSLVAQMNSTASYLAQQLANLGVNK